MSKRCEPAGSATASNPAIEVVEQVAQDHQWHGGYFCTCGHELNSPAGFSRHLLTAYLEAVS